MIVLECFQQIRGFVMSIIYTSIALAKQLQWLEVGFLAYLVFWNFINSLGGLEISQLIWCFRISKDCFGGLQFFQLIWCLGISQIVLVVCSFPQLLSYSFGASEEVFVAGYLPIFLLLLVVQMFSSSFGGVQFFFFFFISFVSLNLFIIVLKT